VGAWRCHRNSCLFYKSGCYRVRGHPDSDGVETCRDYIRHEGGPGHDKSERAWPESIHQRLCRLRSIVRQVLYRSSICYMYYQRVIRRAPLCPVDGFDSRFVKGIGAQPIYRFGGEGDQASRSQYFRSLVQLLVPVRGIRVYLYYLRPQAMRLLFLLSPLLFAEVNCGSILLYHIICPKHLPVKTAFRDKGASIRGPVRRKLY